MKINVNISEILSKALKITWKFKILWIFGILAGFGGSNRGNFNGNSSGGGSGGSNNNFDNGQFSDFFRQFDRLNPQDALASFFSQYAIFIIAGILLLCVLSFVFYFLGVMGKTGLIKGAQKADLGAEKLTFGELWRESLSYFGRMFGLSLLTSLPLFLGVVVILVIFFAALFGVGAVGESSASQAGGVLAMIGMFVPVICCFGLVAIVIGMIVEQTKLAIVIENVGVIEGLKRGWNVLKNNFLVVILFSILLSVLGGMIGFIVAIPVLIVAVPAGISVAMMASQSADTITMFAPLVIAGICLLAYTPILLILQGVEQTFSQTVFTLTYLRLTAPVPEPPVEPLHVE